MKLQSGKCFKILAVFACLVACVVSAQFMRAEYVFQMLHEFFPTNGAPAYLSCALIEGGDGNFYGATGAYPGNSGYASGGTIFKISPSGLLTVIYSFDGSGSNGLGPAGLTFGSNGSFYGVTAEGPFSPGYQAIGDGTVFKVTTNGVLTRLAIFDGFTNGGLPSSPLIQTETGEFYGVTEETVFKVTTNGVLTTLVFFDQTNGFDPRVTGLTRGNNGAFYGATRLSLGGPAFNGTIFRITTDGVFTNLFYFNGTNGRAPTGLCKGTNGLFYGTTGRGGSADSGTVFTMTEDGALTTLVSFPGTDGRQPYGNIIQGRDGNFYGAATSGTNYGTLFKMTPGGELSTIVYFDGTNGLHPFARFTLTSDGNLYGALADIDKKLTLDGNAGVVFRLVEPPNLTISRSAGSVKLSWTSFTNGIYRLEKNSSWDSTNWTSVSSNVTATGNSTSFTNATAGAAQEFYRVVLLP